MKKPAIALMVLPFLFIACSSEVPIKEVRTCSKVIKAGLVLKSGFVEEGLMVKLTLENGKYVYNDSWKYTMWNIDNNLLKTATKMEMGQKYCFTDYEPIK